MSIQRYELKAIVEEYVDLKSLNPKPLFETLDFLFAICGEKPVSEYTRGDARQFVKVYGSKVKTTSVRRRLNSLNAVFNYAKILAFWQLKLYPNTTLTVVFVRVWLSDALQSKHVNLNPKRLNLVGR